MKTKGNCTVLVTKHVLGDNAVITIDDPTNHGHARSVLVCPDEINALIEELEAVRDDIGPIREKRSRHEK